MKTQLWTYHELPKWLDPQRIPEPGREAIRLVLGFVGFMAALIAIGALAAGLLWGIMAPWAEATATREMSRAVCEKIQQNSWFYDIPSACRR